MTSTPIRGQLVQVLVDPASNNGDDIATAIVTKAWSTNLINARVFLDTPHSATIDGLTSVPFLQNEQDVRDTITGIVEKHKATYGQDHVVDMKHVNYAFPLPTTLPPGIYTRLEALEHELSQAETEPAKPAPAVDGTTYDSGTAHLGNGEYVQTPPPYAA